MAPKPSFNDDDDFQELSPLSQSTTTIPTNTSNSYSFKNPQNPTTTNSRPRKKSKTQQPGKENRISHSIIPSFGSNFGLTDDCHFFKSHCSSSINNNSNNNSIESRLIRSRVNSCFNISDNKDGEAIDSEEEDEYELDLLLKLCGESDDAVSNRDDAGGGGGAADSPICCPLCGVDISGSSEEQRQLHTNQCLDEHESSSTRVTVPNVDAANQCPGQVLDGSPVRSPKKVVDVTPVLEWLRNLGLAKYEEVFVREEIDRDTLQWLTEEDLFNIGITAFGPRKKIIHALSELRRDSAKEMDKKADALTVVAEETGKQVTTKLITDYFPGSVTTRPRGGATNKGGNEVVRRPSGPVNKKNSKQNNVKNGKQKNIPPWCCISGTPFRVDAFKYLARDCSHWFLTHFHMDHYQGLTKSFSHGKIYCSSITAKLVNLKIGISWERIEILPLNQKISIAGISITCFDANHCPGSIIILFELANGCLTHWGFPV